MARQLTRCTLGTMLIVPILYLLLQRYFVRGITVAGMGGRQARTGGKLTARRG